MSTSVARLPLDVIATEKFPCTSINSCMALRLFGEVFVRIYTCDALKVFPCVPVAIDGNGACYDWMALGVMTNIVLENLYEHYYIFSYQILDSKYKIL